MLSETYQPQTIETDIQTHWEKNKVFNVAEDPKKEKYYCLSMLPYPSGKLHMGHVRNYTIGDVIARYQRMLGKNVLQPMGWDAFGLPAENAAIQHKVAPAKWTYENIAYMRTQLKRLGFAYDWTREITTCKPDYYRWEQWLFTQLFKKGLVYQKSAVVNWDPVDQTILANEQVVDGRGWRSGALVEKREMPQWFLKITDYADELLTGLDELTQWPDDVRTMQRNWIGRSEGAHIHFDVQGQTESVEVFTTRPDTLMGTTYIAIAPEHSLAAIAANKNPAIQKFIAACRTTSTAEAVIATQEKSGVATEFKAIHPLTNELLPIWIANFVVMEYGTGAVMSVPAHDQRDFEFAQKYHLPIKQVIATPEDAHHDFQKNALTLKGTLINSGEFTGLSFSEAFEKITAVLTQKKKGKKEIHYRLRDWGVSRQRYWGAPIPIIHCTQCGAIPVPEKDLPVILPENVDFTGAQSPLKNMPEFLEVPCPSCHKPAHCETDTFDTFMESSWYYARYTCPDQNQKMLDDRAKYWTPVDQYVGGIEHAVMHLLYARFYHKLLRDVGLVNSDEPFTALLTQGMVLKDGSKMSKSKGNTVDPQPLIEQYGADTVRLFMMFAAPPEQSLEWSDAGVEGAYRFLKRLWSFAYQQQTAIKNIHHQKINFDELTAPEKKMRRDIHEILKQSRYDFERRQFNTVVSSAMKLLNLLSASDTTPALIHEGMNILLCLLTPIVPHITQILWQELNYGDVILDATWPAVDLKALETEEISLVIQVNGKLRGHLSVSSNADEASIKAAALKEPAIQRFLEEKPIKKIILVPKKLINIVV